MKKYYLDNLYNPPNWAAKIHAPSTQEASQMFFAQAQAQEACGATREQQPC